MFILSLADFSDFSREYSSYRGLSESIGKSFSSLWFTILLECIHAIAKQYRSITNCQYVYSQYFLLDTSVYLF